MKTIDDYKKLSRLRKLEQRLVDMFNEAVDTKNFPVYFNHWCSIHFNVGNAIVELKHK